MAVHTAALADQHMVAAGKGVASAVDMALAVRLEHTVVVQVIVADRVLVVV